MFRKGQNFWNLKLFNSEAFQQIGLDWGFFLLGIENGEQTWIKKSHSTILSKNIIQRNYIIFKALSINYYV